MTTTTKLKAADLREDLLRYMGKTIDENGRYELNGVFIQGKSVSLHIIDTIAEDEGSAALEWALHGLKDSYEFLEGLNVLDAGFGFVFPEAGKLA